MFISDVNGCEGELFLINYHCVHLILYVMRTQAKNGNLLCLVDPVLFLQFEAWFHNSAQVSKTTVVMFVVSRKDY